MGGRDPANFLAPGFRFHPTDEELVKFYLKRKVYGRAFRFDAIAEADVYKCEPWDLPDKSALKSRDLEWYFFSGLDKKYGHGSKTNRATERGYWKTTGKDRPVRNNSVVVGMKKTLVYHIGRAPRGERTNWVMHEYRLADSELEKAGVAQASFVLCRIFQKSGPGPKNGEQHGAPFIEEEWEDKDEILVPGEQAQDDGTLIADGAYLETDDLDQLIDFNVSPGNYPLQTNYCHGCSSNQFEDSKKFCEEGQKPSVGAHENLNESKLPVSEQQYFGELKPCDAQGNLPTGDYFSKPDDIASHDVNYLLDEPYFEGNYDEAHREGLFLETDDLLTPIEADPSSFDMLHEYLADFNANDEIFYMPPNISKAVTASHIPLDIVQKQAEGETQKVAMVSEQLVNAHGDDAISSSNQNCNKFGSGSKNRIVEHANCMLESIPAPPAFAAEFPTKEAALRLASAMQSQNSVNVTANMIHARNTSTASNGLSWSFDKNGKVQLIFSLSVGQGGGHLDSAASLDGLVPSKTKSATWRSWIYLILFWVSILFISMKIGTCVVYTK